MAKIVATRLPDELEEGLAKYCEDVGCSQSAGIRQLLAIALGEAPDMVARREAVFAAISAGRTAINKYVGGFADRVRKDVKEAIE